MDQQRDPVPTNAADEGRSAVARLRSIELELARVSLQPRDRGGWGRIAADLREAAEAAASPRVGQLAAAAAGLSERLAQDGRPIGPAALKLFRSTLRRLHDLCLDPGAEGDEAEFVGALELVAAEIAGGRAPDLAFDLKLASDVAAAQSEPRRRRAASPLREGAVRLEAVWSGLADLVRRQGEARGKRVELVVTGGELEVAGSCAPALRTALVHLARDACDNGVETPAARQGAGKPLLAIVRLSARRSGEQVTVTLADDGRGCGPGGERTLGPTLRDPRALVAAASQMLGLMQGRAGGRAGAAPAAASAPLSEEGLGAVRQAVEDAGGRVALASAPGRGAAFTFTLPAPRDRARPAA